MATSLDIPNAMKNIRPLDVILVRGSTTFATLIAYTEATALKCDPPDTFSHVGIVISRDVIDDPLLEDGKLYIWESCLTHGVYSVHHPEKKFLGSQVRPLKETLIDYASQTGGKVAWLSYRDSSSLPDFNDGFRRRFTQFFKNNNNIYYDGNPFSLCGAVFRWCRPVARMTQLLSGTERLMFCSELVSKTLIFCNVLSPAINPSCVLPQDFLGFDNELDPEQRIPKDLFSECVVLYIA
jgi:hypothetical protein